MQYLHACDKLKTPKLYRSLKNQPWNLGEKIVVVELVFNSLLLAFSLTNSTLTTSDIIMARREKEQTTLHTAVTKSSCLMLQDQGTTMVKFSLSLSDFLNKLLKFFLFNCFLSSYLPVVVSIFFVNYLTKLLWTVNCFKNFLHLQ